MSDELDLLIGDAERTSAANELRHHYEAGRITLEELELRLDRVNAARTESDLHESLLQLPAKSLPSFNPRDRRWSSLVMQYVALNAIAVLVWLTSDGQSNFWPKWVFVATAILFVRRVIGTPHESRRLSRRISPPPLPPHDDR